MFASTLNTLKKRTAGLIKGESSKADDAIADDEYLDKSEVRDVWAGGRNGPVIVRYEVQNDSEGDKDGAAFVLQGSPDGVTVGLVRRSFPLPGRFHFRFKAPTPDHSFGGYSWMDISVDSETVPLFRGEVCMRALRLPAEAGERRMESLPGSLLRSAAVPLDIDFGAASPSDSDGASGAFDEPEYSNVGQGRPQAFEAFQPEPRSPQRQQPRPPPEPRDLMETGFDNSPSPMPAAPPRQTAGPPSDLMDLGGLDAGLGAASSGAAGGGGPASPPKVFDRQALVAEREAREKKRIDDANKRHLETKAAEEQMKKDKVDQGNKLHQELMAWAKTPDGTAFKDIKALLSTMDKVMWENSGWEPVSLADLLEPAKVKKAYRKAIIMCHPDRQQDAAADVQVRADRIFEALNAAFKNST